MGKAGYGTGITRNTEEIYSYKKIKKNILVKATEVKSYKRRIRNVEQMEKRVREKARIRNIERK